LPPGIAISRDLVGAGVAAVCAIAAEESSIPVAAAIQIIFTFVSCLLWEHAPGWRATDVRGVIHEVHLPAGINLLAQPIEMSFLAALGDVQSERARPICARDSGRIDSETTQPTAAVGAANFNGFPSAMLLRYKTQRDTWHAGDFCDESVHGRAKNRR
jgi:hypothetical protein